MTSVDSLEAGPSYQQETMKHPFIYFMPVIPNEHYTHFQQRLILSFYESFESKSKSIMNISSKKLRSKKLFILPELSSVSNNMQNTRPFPNAAQQQLMTENRLLQLERRFNLLREQLPPMQLAVSNTINNIMMPNMRNRQRDNNSEDRSDMQNSPEHMDITPRRSTSRNELNLEIDDNKSIREDKSHFKPEPTSRESQEKKLPGRNPFIKLTHLDVLDIAKSSINDRYLVFITKAGFAGRILIGVINSIIGNSSEQKNVYSEEQYQPTSTGNNLGDLPQEPQATSLGMPGSSNSFQVILKSFLIQHSKSLF